MWSKQVDLGEFESFSRLGCSTFALGLSNDRRTVNELKELCSHLRQHRSVLINAAETVYLVLLQGAADVLSRQAHVNRVSRPA